MWNANLHYNTSKATSMRVNEFRAVKHFGGGGSFATCDVAELIPLKKRTSDKPSGFK